ncbi:MAG: DNA-processing protein DprA [Bacteroidales bacterium]|nr:DNA-processing protein DprA [Bacteroidales bacterium]
MPESQNNIKYLIALSFIKGVGSVTARQLISYLGSAEAIFKASKASLQKIPGVGPVLASNLKDINAIVLAEKELEFADRYHIDILSYTESNYPKLLKECNDAPLVLYQKSKYKFNDTYYISIVGTRKPSPYGEKYCKQLIESLAVSKIPIVIVSGLAYGIDACAHKSALEFGLPTIAVLGHGLDLIYPSSHKQVATSIINNGSLLTEFPQGTKPARSNFVSRNRIIAGLSEATIVIESATKGGSLITADFAFGYNREVLALPGRADDLKSGGCNFLIKTQKATMYESFDDLVKVLNWDTLKGTQTKINVAQNLSEEQLKLYQWMKSQADFCSIDRINIQSGLNKNIIPALLLDLEFLNLVKAIPGGQYQIL